MTYMNFIMNESHALHSVMYNELYSVYFESGMNIDVLIMFMIMLASIFIFIT